MRCMRATRFFSSRRAVEHQNVRGNASGIVRAAEADTRFRHWIVLVLHLLSCLLARSLLRDRVFHLFLQHWIRDRMGAWWSIS